MGHDPSAQRYPFFSGLDCPPRMCWDVPWLEQSSVKGKPHFVYEFNIGCRTKYRAEAATRIAALGSIEDWDIINWHTYGFRADPDKKDPFNGPIHVWHDYFEYGNDEVQLSAMKVAGEIFKNRLVNPAPNPTTFVIGKHTFFDPSSMEYGRSYGDYKDLLVPTCYRYGSRIWCDPARTTDTIIGNSCKLGVYESNPVRPIECPAIDGMKYVLRDWHMRVIGEGVIKEGRIAIPADKPVFIAELSR